MFALISHTPALPILLTNISLHVHYPELGRWDLQFESLLLLNKDWPFEAMLLNKLWSEVRALTLQEDVITTVCVCAYVYMQVCKFNDIHVPNAKCK